MSRAVILLKSPLEGVDDAYARHFASSGYKTHFIEILTSSFSNYQRLVDIIRVGPGSYAGVVVTSSRAAEAWIHALKGTDALGDWTHTPFYTIGEATARGLRRITALHPNNFSENLILGAAQSGESEALALFILTDLPGRKGSKLLYLTGDKNRDTFSRLMGENMVVVENLRVYETKAADDLEEKIDRVAREIKQEETEPTWIVFFAPSSSDFALPHFRRYFRWSETTGSSQGEGMNARIAAIGPTTAKFLRDERRLVVDVVPSKPVPEQLVQAICNADKEPYRLSFV